MAVVPRKRSRTTVYYVANRWRGKIEWERVGTDKRAAERRDAAVKREIEAGTYVPKRTEASTVRAYAEAWFSARAVRSVENERDLWTNHVLERCEWFADLRVDAVTPPLSLRLVRELEKPYVRGDRAAKLAPKSVALIAGVCRTMFGAAVFEQAIPSNPFVLPPGTLHRKPRKERGHYGASDVVAIVNNEKVRPDGRMFAALALYTGMREGEICGRRFRDVDRGARPLWSMDVRSQYDDQPLKTDDEDTDRPRRIPVHPELARLLDWWWSLGFHLVHCRAPTPADFIVPTDAGEPRSKSSGYKLWRSTLKDADVENLSLHSTRHTFVTWMRRCGAPDYLLERITHNAGGTIVDQYTHADWVPLCQAISLLSFDAVFDGSSKGSVSPEESWLQRLDSNRGAGSATAANRGKTGLIRDESASSNSSSFAAIDADVDASQTPGRHLSRATLRAMVDAAQRPGGTRAVVEVLAEMVRCI